MIFTKTGLAYFPFYKSEVKQITYRRNGWYYIKTADPSNLIAVPAQIENRDQLEAMLSEIMPISNKTRFVLSPLFAILFRVVVLQGMIACFLSTDKLIVAVTGLILIGIMSYCLCKG
jgi:hypothetical protein